MSIFKVTIQRKDQVLAREVSKDSFTVGRSLDCDISLNDHHVSRVHIVVSRRWNTLWIEDKNSSNGTFVNGTKIVQGTPVNVVPSDKIQLGRSEYLLAVELLQEYQEEPPIEEVPPAEEPVLEETVAMPPPNMAPFQAEKILHDAKRKAAQIILEGETQAEKRVQAIYQRAREVQSQADLFHQTRMAEAHKEADAILADYQQQGRNLLQDARNMAQELREEVDVYVQSLKEKAKNDVEDLISETTLAAEKMKTEALESGRLAGQSDADIILKTAREEAARMLDFAQLQTQEIRDHLKSDQQLLEQITADLKNTKNQLEEVSNSLQKTRTEESNVLEQIKQEKEQVSQLQAQQGTLSEQNNSLETTLKSLQEKQAKLSMDVHDIESKKNHLFKEYEAQKIFLNEKLEKEKSAILKTEEERLEEMRLETSRRLQKMERELLEDIVAKKTTLIKEIHASVEKEIVVLVEPTRWSQISKSVEEHIKEAVEGRLASLSHATAGNSQPVRISTQRKSERLRWGTVGLALGALVYFTSQVVLEKVSRDQAPMQTLVRSEAKKRQEELEKRRFNPPQAEELKDSYTDAVVYTRNFPDVYSDQQFQQKLYKAASVYLLKTWRVDEDKSIQVLATATALVKELTERKSKIHPDFIKEGLEKMRQLETDTLARMKDILGSEVRVESFRRFERNFYKEEIQRRRMAQH